jgi:hypothetical protein
MDIFQLFTRANSVYSHHYFESELPYFCEQGLK